MHVIVVGGLVDVAYDTIVEDDTIALAVAAVKPGGKLVAILPTKEPLIRELSEPKNVQWITAKLHSSEHNKEAFLELLSRLPGLLEEGVLKVRKSTHSSSCHTDVLFSQLRMRYYMAG